MAFSFHSLAHDLRAHFTQEHDVEGWKLLKVFKAQKAALSVFSTFLDIHSSADRELVCSITAKMDGSKTPIEMKMAGYACKKLLVKEDLTKVELDYHVLDDPKEKGRPFYWVVDVK